MNDAPVRQVATPQPYSDFDRLPIGGGWRRAKTSHVLADRDPYTGQVILEIPQADRSQAASVSLYALALGAMAASAWASVFPRYRVGAGAALFVVSDLLLFAEMGPLQASVVPQVMVWPLYYLAQFLIAVGIVQTLRKRDPELKIVVNN